jgi:hypothetical protein
MSKSRLREFLTILRSAVRKALENRQSNGQIPIGRKINLASAASELGRAQSVGRSARSSEPVFHSLRLPESMTDSKKEISLSDVGTRYEHLQEHCDSLEACVAVLKAKGIYSQNDKERLAKLTAAFEVTRATLDAFTGINESTTEYSLYRLLNSIPKDPEAVEGGRGTPLC